MLWASGKTTLLNVMSGGASVETVPTIGLNVKMVKKGGVNMKCWDIGGQKQYSAWRLLPCSIVCPTVVSDPFCLPQEVNGDAIPAVAAALFSLSMQALYVNSGIDLGCLSRWPSSQIEQIPQARKELHRLLEDRCDRWTVA